MARGKRYCPYLGLRNDRDTCISYPSPGNSCYRGPQPVSVLLEYQESCCLTDTYPECPVYQGGGKVMLSRENREPNARQKRRIQNGVMAAILILLALGTAWMVYANQVTIKEFMLSLEPRPEPASTYIAPTFMVGSAQAEAYQPLILTTAQASTVRPPEAETESPQVTVTPTYDGPENGRGFVIHKVQSGESLDQLADKYYTSSAAILDINYKLAPPIPADRTIVIPEGIVKTGKYPQFEVKYIPEKTKVAFIVEKYECDPVLFQQFNRPLIVTSLDIPYILDKQWVLIPRERTKKAKP